MVIETKLDKDFVFYINGNYVPLTEAKISVLDAGWHGDSVYDTLRTIKRTEVYRIDDHVERLFTSCQGAGIDPCIKPDVLKGIITEIAIRNSNFLCENEDGWIIPRISSGSLFESGDPSLIVMFLPLPFKMYAKFFITGTHLFVATTRHVPPECIDSGIKYDARMFMHIADREAKRFDPECRTLLLDINGNIAELTNANIFVVKDGVVNTPTTRNILSGISRKVVLELCEKLGIPAIERDMDLSYLEGADEAFQTGTSYRMLPISRINGAQLWHTIPGPITERIITAYIEEIGIDFVDQYLSHLSDEDRKSLLEEVQAS